MNIKSQVYIILSENNNVTVEDFIRTRDEIFDKYISDISDQDIEMLNKMAKKCCLRLNGQLPSKMVIENPITPWTKATYAHGSGMVDYLTFKWEIELYSSYTLFKIKIKGIRVYFIASQRIGNDENIDLLIHRSIKKQWKQKLKELDASAIWARKILLLGSPATFEDKKLEMKQMHNDLLIIKKIINMMGIEI